MKKLKLFLPFVLIAMIISCSDRNENTYTGGNSLFNPDSVGFVQVDSFFYKIDSISKISSELKRLDSLQNGMCDTCVAGYQSAIIENRKVAETLSNRTEILEEKIQKVDNQIYKIDSLLSSNDVQLSKLKVLNRMAQREQKKQKNEFYALTKDN